MATVTLRIRLRRTTGRFPVDDADLADALAEALYDTTPEVPDSSGEDATYEVSHVEYLALTPLAPEEIPCARCGGLAEPDPVGRPRLYCSSACRQAAYRSRRR